ncbi:nicotinate-nucleotide adenylyltransferase [Candidatus Soleaferrea massiliensis]|uniref:nicotinate-nucleotide adenylyltransferase n=1 Tax=Candidatus Soleaferrea massiliensis TaxID=1470354 RepID=UPI000694F7F3|nr:nicotinate-nucleotide adenylyltransferase [Candidatus Soleaferrea massiliensis]
MQKIGVFGGSFNPIHSGHIHLAEKAAEQFGLDKVLLIPANIPPHKKAVGLVSGEDRLHMCSLAAEDHPLFEVSDIEIKRKGKSYTYDTLKALKKEYEDAQFYLIIGSDMFLTFHTWHRFEDILKMSFLCTAPRSREQMFQLRNYRQNLGAKREKVYLMDMQVVPLSSTHIREHLKVGMPLGGGVLPEAVQHYIEETGLYNLTVDAYKELLQKKLTPYRYYHSCKVAGMAVRLARHYREDVGKALRAGLLHDIMKDTKGDVQLQIMKKFGIMTDMVSEIPQLWHSLAGSLYVKHVLEISDEDIIHAVRYHTSARANMSRLEKIIYLADLVSEDRDYKDVKRMREIAFASLEEGMREALLYSVSDLNKKQRAIVGDTREAYQQYCAG